MQWLLAVAALLAALALLWLLQDGLIFHPQRMPEARRLALSDDAQSIFLPAADGTRLHAWYVPGAPLIIYFGGNAEDVSWMLGPAKRNAPGAGWLLVDYRGYGSSEGRPSEAALAADALRFYDHAREKLGARRIFVFGRSLGSGVAVQLVAARPVAGAILVAPYDSLTSVGRHHYPFVPVGWMLKHRFDSLAHAPGIAVPLLCLVAQRDEVIPIVHSKRLFDAWKGPKRWVELGGAGHNSTDDVPVFWPAIREFLVQPH